MRKYFDAAQRAVGSDYSRPVAMLLALSLLLVFQSVASAGLHNVTPPDVFNPAAIKAATVPDTVRGPGSDRVPPSLACVDEMDFPPDDYLPGPADAEHVSVRQRPGKALARPVAAESPCLKDPQKVHTV